MSVSVHLIAAARPNFMKVAPLYHALKATDWAAPILVHTGQHYDDNMSRLFFDELGIPKADVNLEVGSGSHARQTAEIMTRFEPLLIEHRPDAVLVVGDVNSTIACARVAKTHGVRVVHVEAGLRSFDRSMPEEINRVVTDRLSDWLLTHSPDADENLLREGVPRRKIHQVGNIMIDSLVANLKKAGESDILQRFGLQPSGYGVVTLHRPSNVDDDGTLKGIIGALRVLSEEIRLIFPCHPRTRGRVEALGLLDGADSFQLTTPLGYLDFMKLLSESRLVLSDSGGIQEETTILGVPCLTLRDNTERPVTLELGTNQLVGTDPAKILAAYSALMNGETRDSQIPPLWDGAAAQRIADVLVDVL